MYYIYIEGYTEEDGVKINTVLNLRAMEDFSPSMDLLRRVCNDLSLTNFIIVKASTYKVGDAPEIYFNSPTINDGVEIKPLDLTKDQINILADRVAKTYSYNSNCKCDLCERTRNVNKD